MKISAEYKDGVVKTSLPCLSYDMSAKEHDASLLALASSIVAACADNIGDGDEELSMIALDAITSCAKTLMKQGQF